MNKKIIDYDLLEKNVKRLSCKKICAMVKANAYGLGIENVVPFLEDKVDFFGVSSIDEADEVRKISNKKILIVSKVLDLDRCKEKGYHFMVDDFEALEEAKRKKISEQMHIKINVGMNRFGFSYEPKTLKRLRIALKSTKIGGIYTHFPCLSDRNLTIKQYKLFLKIKKFLRKDALIHFGGSKVIDYNFDYDMIRVGIGLYAKDESVMKISSKIIKIHKLNSGFVGYDGKMAIEKLTKIALVPIGYADGLLRAFSGTYVHINGKRCKIVGNICMDMCFVDISEASASVGDEVIFLNDLAEISNKTRLTKYEILTGFNRLRPGE